MKTSKIPLETKSRISNGKTKRKRVQPSKLQKKIEAYFRVAPKKKISAQTILSRSDLKAYRSRTSIKLSGLALWQAGIIGLKNFYRSRTSIHSCYIEWKLRRMRAKILKQEKASVAVAGERSFYRSRTSIGIKIGKSKVESLKSKTSLNFGKPKVLSLKSKVQSIFNFIIFNFFTSFRLQTLAFRLRKIKFSLNSKLLKKSFASLTILAVLVTAYFQNTPQASAATFTMYQPDWTGVGATAQHSGNPQTQVDTYSAADPKIDFANSGNDLKLLTTSGTPAVQNTDAAFQASTGPNTNTTDDSGNNRVVLTKTSTATTITQNTDAVFNNGNFGSPAYTQDDAGHNRVKLIQPIAAGNSTTPYSCTSGTCTLSSGTLNYSTFNVSSGAILQFSGTNPVTINANGNVTIDGTLKLYGGNGGDASSGVIGSAGAAGTGGSSGGSNNTGGSGAGSGGTGGGGSGLQWGGGGGGGGHIGFAGAGAGGAGYPTAGGTGGSSYTTPSNAGGSGGGSGRSDASFSYYGGGGGGGGGSITINSSGSVTVGVTGSINAKGGIGGSGYGIYSGGGGGGGGGNIAITAVSIANNNVINASGNSGGTGGTNAGSGGGGGGGKVTISTNAGSASFTGNSPLANYGSGGGGSSPGGTGSAGSIITNLMNPYYSSGTYTYYVDSSQATPAWSGFNFTKAASGGTTTLQVQVASKADTASAPTFPSGGACDSGAYTTNSTYTSGDISACAGNNRYLWYKVTFTASADALNTPYLTQFQASTNTVYNTTGTFTSSVMDTGHLNTAADFTWDDNLNGGSDSMQIKGSTTSGGLAGKSWCDISKGDDIFSKSSGCVDPNSEYFQYQATLNSVSPYSATPYLNSVTINDTYYPSQSLTSPVYDSTSPDNLINAIAWNETGTSTTETVGFQIRSSADGSTNWTNWCGAGDTTSCSGNNYFTDSSSGCSINGTLVTCGSTVMPAVIKDLSSDRYFQYKATLFSGGAATPDLSDATITYVENAAPTFSGGLGNDAQEVDTGKINNISYTFSNGPGENTPPDTFNAALFYAPGNGSGLNLHSSLNNTNTTSVQVDGAAGAYLPATNGYIQIDNEVIKYASKTGSSSPFTLNTLTRGTWVTGTASPVRSTTIASHNCTTTCPTVYAQLTTANITTTTGGTGIGDLSVSGDVTNKNYVLSWDAKDDTAFNTNTVTSEVGRYETQLLLKVSVNDGNAANMIGSATSGSAFTVDTLAPQSPQVTVDRSVNTDQIEIGAIEDTQTGMSYAIDLPSTDVDGNNGACDFSSPSWQPFTYPSQTVTFTDYNDAVRKVCVLFKDAYGNISANTNNYALSPENPYAFKYYDTSNPTINFYRIFLSWGIPKDTAEGTGGFKEYDLYRCKAPKGDTNPCSDTPSNFSLYANIEPDKNVNYYNDDESGAGLDDSQRYCYKYLVKDKNTSFSGDSSKWSDPLCVNPGSGENSLNKPVAIHWYTNPDGSPNPDLNVPPDKIFTTQATIKWKTVNAADTNEDLIADSTVWWRQSGSTGWTESHTVSSPVIDHTITIPGLKPGTTYEYKVVSTTPWGTTDEVQGAPPEAPATFTTLSGPVIKSVTTSNIGNTSATITWDTYTAAKQGTVLISSGSATVAGNGTQFQSTFHVGDTILVSGQTSRKIAEIASDTSLTVNIPYLTADSGLTYQTTENTTSVAYYATAIGDDGDLAAPQTGNCDGGYVSHHTCTLSTPLVAGTEYYFYVFSAEDPAYGDGYSADTNEGKFYSFKTTTDDAPPQILHVNNDQADPVILTDTQAAISWETNERAESWIIFSPTSHSTGYTPPTLNFDPNNLSDNPYLNDDPPGDPSKTYLANSDADFSHTFIMSLNSLTPDTPYFYRLVSQDTSGNVTVSQEYPFTTLDTLAEHQDLTNPGNPVVDQYSDTEAVIHLPAANSESTSRLCYGTAAIADGDIDAGTGTCANHVDVTTETMTHYYHLTGLAAHTLYHVKSKIVDADKAGIAFISSSAPNDVTFTTRTAPDQQHDPISDISTPGSSDITTGTTYAFVSWTTDQPSDSLLECGTHTGGPYGQSASSAAYNKEHTIKIISLSPNTDYYCIASSTDNLGNTLYTGNVTSIDDPDLDEFHFKTDKPADQQHNPLTSITNVNESVITDTNAAVTFDTDQGALCLAEVTTASGDYGNPSVYKEDGYDQLANFNLHHTITFSGLLFSTNYYYKLTCEDNLGTIKAEQISNQHYFTTLPQQTDHPVLSGIGTLDVPQYSDTEALVTLPAVNTESYSKLCYDTQAITDIDNCAHHQDIDNSDTPNGTKTHYYHLSNLTASTHYYLAIKVTDATDTNTNFTATKEFDTTSAPLTHTALTDPGNPGALQISDTEATITLPAKTTDDEVSTNSTATSKLCWDTAAIANVETCANHQEILSPTRLHYYHLTNLTPKTTYHIQTKVTDELDANTNFTSEDVTFTTSDTLYTAAGWQQQGSSDTAPTISNVKSGTITGESATITWDTDKDSNSLVKYGISSGTYDNVAGDPITLSDTTKYATTHSVIANGLTPGTKYYFIAMSADVAGTTGTSSESSFSTKAASNLSSIKITSTKLGEALVTWSTSQKTTSIVDYGTTNLYGQSKADNTSATTHSIDITGLTQNTEYHFRVEGKDVNNNIYSSGDYTFTPKSPPVVTNVKTQDVTEHEATVVFDTNVPTDALITYTSAEGGSASGGNTQDTKDTGSQGKPDLLTSHAVILQNLTSGATYTYTLTAKDYDGNSASYPVQGQNAPSFIVGKDTNPPKIDQVRTDSALAQNNEVQTIISWTTDEPATTSLIYQEGQSGAEKEVQISSQSTTTHIAVITTFKPGVVYYFKVKSDDPSGNTATSSNYALLTPKQQQNIIQIIISNFTDIFGWATKR